MTLDLANIVGLIGSALMVVAYGYSNWARTVDFVRFNALNLIGAILLMSSLMVHVNVASLALEVVWSLIALAGLVKALRARAAGVIVAVDGPAASGKGTIARAIARHYALPHLDTGLLYRAVGIGVLRNGGDPADPGDALAATHFGDDMLADGEIRSEAAGRAASLVSTHPAVRAALLDRQRAFAAQPRGAVLDGRDIGTVIAPAADAKLFVTATSEVRAERRWRELTGLGLAVHLEAVLHDIRARDERDSARAAAPLRMASDAHLLDTSMLSVAAAIAGALALIEHAPPPRPANDSDARG